MALPQQVERDLAEIEAYEKQLRAEQNPPEAQPPETQPDESAPPATEVKPADQSKPVTPAPEAKPDTPNWEQKYRTLQGMYDAEVPRLHKQVKEQAAQLQTMQEQLTALAKPTTEAPKPERLITEKDETEYGKELLDVQRRVAMEVMREHVAPLQDELKKRDAVIAELRAAQVKTGGEVAAVSFDQRLAQAIPNFAQLNADPKWIAWLDEIDPYTQEPRRTFAEYVFNNQDLNRLKQVVDFYTKSTAVDPEQAERQQRQAELERQITPNRANTQQTTTPTQNTRIYTEAEMVAGFSQVRKLNAAGKYDDATKLETELSAAYMENRVRG